MVGWNAVKRMRLLSTSFRYSQGLKLCSCTKLSSGSNMHQFPPNMKVFVQYIPRGISAEELTKHMESAGRVECVRILSNRKSQYYTSGIVVYASAVAAATAIATLHSSKIRGRAIDVHTQVPNDTPAVPGESTPVYLHRPLNAYVTRLDAATNEGDLKGHFSSCGAVVKVLLLRDSIESSQRSALVTFRTPEEVKNAINTLNLSVLKGCQIIVRADVFREDRAPKARPAVDESRAVFVTNLRYDADEASVRELMEFAGQVRSIKLFKEPNGQSKGRAIVEYTRPLDALNALRHLDGVEFHNRPIYIRECRPT